MATDTMTFSKFLRDSGEAVKSAQEGTVRLERRDGDDLILRRADRDDSEREGLRLAVALLSRALADADSRARTDMLGDVFPWVVFLPDQDQTQFATEVIESIKASSAIDRPDLIATLVTQWKNTAEIWADPELKARLESKIDPVGETILQPR